MLLNHTAAGIAYYFDEPNLISSAGLAPVIRLAQSAGLKNFAFLSRLDDSYAIRAATLESRSLLRDDNVEQSFFDVVE